MIIETLDHVRSLAEKLVVSISGMATPALQNIKIGASVGVSLYPDHSNDTRELLTQADEAMYKVKHQGKSGYFIYGEGIFQPIQ